MTREDFITSYVGKHMGDDASRRQKLETLAGFAWDAVKFKGTATAAEVEALADMENGDQYRIITTGGTLNTGGNEITTLVGDVVVYDGENEEWVFVVSGAAINV